MIVLKDEIEELTRHPYVRSCEVKDKLDFANKMYRFVFHLRDIVNKVGINEHIKAIECGMDDWCEYINKIRYNLYEDLETVEKIQIVNYLNIVFREIMQFINYGKFKTITRKLVEHQYNKFPLYPQYKYCKNKKKWVIYLERNRIPDMFMAVKDTDYEPQRMRDFLLNYYNNWYEMWGNDEDTKL
jgi:hypothetical protein